jgi:heptosyltransferase-2
MKKILIIKEGTLGGLVRITPLLRVLKGNVYWLTLPGIKSILPAGNKVHVIDINKFREDPKRIKFDLVLNLEDSAEIAKLVAFLAPKRIVGAYWNEAKRKVDYTAASAGWFNMGSLSKLGPRKADKLKYSNRKSYQEILFGMLGLKFKKEEYLLPLGGKFRRVSKRKISIAIEDRAGEKWPMKRWPHYDLLEKKLKQAGFDVYYLRQRKKISDYIKDINKCDVLVSGDTLAMHVGLALKKQLVSLFMCTSPWEVYDYGRMTKIVSPLLKKGFYKRTYLKDVVEAVKVDDVFDAVVQRTKFLKSSR